MNQEKILSIRLSPGGLSFWTTEAAVGGAKSGFSKPKKSSMPVEMELKFDPAKERNMALLEAVGFIKEEVGDFRSIEVYPDTFRTVVVPEEYASADALVELLRVNNITPDAADEVVYAGVSPIIKAVVVYDCASINLLREVAGDIAITSPFGINSAVINRYGAGRKRSTSIYLTPAHAYITVFEKKSGAWLYADVMKWSAPTDILYYMSVLDQQFELRKGNLYLRGSEACEVGALLRKYFKKTRCE